MKGTPGEKEHSDRHMRSHHSSTGGKQFNKKVVSTAMSAQQQQRPVRTALFGRPQEASSSKHCSSGSFVSSCFSDNGLLSGRLLSGSIEKFVLGCTPVEAMSSSPKGPRQSADRSGTFTPVREADSPNAFRSTAQSCPAAFLSRQSTRSPSSPGYAGARFSEAPSPKVLPKPPVHWFDADESDIVSPAPCGFSGTCREMTNALKGLLKVQC